MTTKIVKIENDYVYNAGFLFNKLTSTRSRRRMRKSKESTCLLWNSIPCPEYSMNAKQCKGGAELWLRERASIDFTLTIATNCFFFAIRYFFRSSYVSHVLQERFVIKLIIPLIFGLCISLISRVRTKLEIKYIYPITSKESLYR